MEQKTDDEGGGGSGSAPTLAPILANALLKETGIARNLISFTSVPQTFRLLLTCKELHGASMDVFSNHKLPMVCYMNGVGNGFKMYRAMVGLNSRWLEWFDTSGVEVLSLGESVTDEEMSVMFGGKRFSELQTLNLSRCGDITDASVLEVARQCANLQKLYLAFSRKITDASVLEVARRCSNLQSLDLRWCDNITAACKNALQQSHPELAFAVNDGTAPL